MSGDKQHILIVDDDATLRRRLVRYLNHEGYKATGAHDGQAMRRALEQEPAALVILDLVMPGEDGLSLTRYLRGQSDIGILILTGKGDTVDRVVGLEMGADDYIAKPFDPRELLARVRSILRRQGRATQAPAPDSETSLVTFDGWKLDMARRELTSDSGENVHLTSTEFDLLAAFIRHPNRALSRDQLMDAAAGRDWSPFDRSIDLHISHLRRKIEKDPRNPRLIKTLRGAGYIFSADVV
jgi:DNA-binding response OmpR family regulator